MRKEVAAQVDKYTASKNLNDEGSAMLLPTDSSSLRTLVQRILTEQLYEKDVMNGGKEVQKLKLTVEGNHEQHQDLFDRLSKRIEKLEAGQKDSVLNKRCEQLQEEVGRLDQQVLSARSDVRQLRAENKMLKEKLNPLIQQGLFFTKFVRDYEEYQVRVGENLKRYRSEHADLLEATKLMERRISDSNQQLTEQICSLESAMSEMRVLSDTTSQNERMETLQNGITFRLNDHSQQLEDIRTRLETERSAVQKHLESLDKQQKDIKPALDELNSLTDLAEVLMGEQRTQRAQLDDLKSALAPALSLDDKIAQAMRDFSQFQTQTSFQLESHGKEVHAFVTESLKQQDQAVEERLFSLMQNCSENLKAADQGMCAQIEDAKQHLENQIHQQKDSITRHCEQLVSEVRTENQIAFQEWTKAHDYRAYIDNKIMEETKDLGKTLQGNIVPEIVTRKYLDHALEEQFGLYKKVVLQLSSSAHEDSSESAQIVGSLLCHHEKVGQLRSDFEEQMEKHRASIQAEISESVSESMKKQLVLVEEMLADQEQRVKESQEQERDLIQDMLSENEGILFQHTEESTKMIEEFGKKLNLHTESTSQLLAHGVASRKLQTMEESIANLSKTKVNADQFHSELTLLKELVSTAAAALEQATAETRESHENTVSTIEFDAHVRKLQSVEEKVLLVPGMKHLLDSMQDSIGDMKSEMKTFQTAEECRSRFAEQKAKSDALAARIDPSAKEFCHKVLDTAKSDICVHEGLSVAQKYSALEQELRQVSVRVEECRSAGDKLNVGLLAQHECIEKLAESQSVMNHCWKKIEEEHKASVTDWLVQHQVDIKDWAQEHFDNVESAAHDSILSLESKLSKQQECMGELSLQVAQVEELTKGSVTSLLRESQAQQAQALVNQVTDLKQNIESHQNQIFTDKFLYLKNDFDQLKHEQEEVLTRNMVAVTDKMAKFTQDVHQLQTDQEQALTEKISQVEAKIEPLKATVNELLALRDKLPTKQLEGLRRDVDQLRNDQQNELMNKVSDLENLVEELKSSFQQTLSDKLSALLSDMQALETNISESQAKDQEEWHNQIAELKQHFTELKTKQGQTLDEKASALQSLIHKLESELEQNLGQNESVLNEKLEGLAEVLKSIQTAQNEDFPRTLTRLNEEIEQVRQRGQSLESRIETTEQERISQEQHLTQDIGKLKEDIDSLRKEQEIIQLDSTRLGDQEIAQVKVDLIQVLGDKIKPLSEKIERFEQVLAAREPALQGDRPFEQQKKTVTDEFASLKETFMQLKQQQEEALSLQTSRITSALETLEHRFNEKYDEICGQSGRVQADHQQNVDQQISSLSEKIETLEHNMDELQFTYQKQCDATQMLLESTKALQQGLGQQKSDLEHALESRIASLSRDLQSLDNIIGQSEEEAQKEALETEISALKQDLGPLTRDQQDALDVRLNILESKLHIFEQGPVGLQQDVNDQLAKFKDAFDNLMAQHDQSSKDNFTALTNSVGVLEASISQTRKVVEEQVKLGTVDSLKKDMDLYKSEQESILTDKLEVLKEMISQNRNYLEQVLVDKTVVLERLVGAYKKEQEQQLTYGIRDMQHELHAAHVDREEAFAADWKKQLLSLKKDMESSRGALEEKLSHLSVQVLSASDHEEGLNDLRAALQELTDKVHLSSEQLENKYQAVDCASRNQEESASSESTSDSPMPTEMAIATVTNNLEHQKKLIYAQQEKVAEIEEKMAMTKGFAQEISKLQLQYETIISERIEGTFKSSVEAASIRADMGEVQISLGEIRKQLADLEKRILQQKIAQQEVAETLSPEIENASAFVGLQTGEEKPMDQRSMSLPDGMGSTHESPTFKANERKSDSSLPEDYSQEIIAHLPLDVDGGRDITSIARGLIDFVVDQVFHPINSANEATNATEMVKAESAAQKARDAADCAAFAAVFASEAAASAKCSSILARYALNPDVTFDATRGSIDAIVEDECSDDRSDNRIVEPGARGSFFLSPKTPSANISNESHLTPLSPHVDMKSPPAILGLSPITDTTPGNKSNCSSVYSVSPMPAPDYLGSDMGRAHKDDSNVGDDEDAINDAKGRAEGVSSPDNIKSSQGSTLSAEVTCLSEACVFKMHDNTGPLTVDVSLRQQDGVLLICWSTHNVNPPAFQGFPLTELDKILVGKLTRSFAQPSVFDVDSSCCLSLLSSNCVLDLEADDEVTRNQWVQSIRKVRDEYCSGPLEIVYERPLIAAGSYPDDRRGFISVTAKNLPQSLNNTPLNPLVSLFKKDLQTGKYTYVGQTERQQQRSSPTFKKSMRVCLPFKGNMPLRFNIYHVNNPNTTRVREQDRVASASISLGHLVEQGLVELPLTHSRNENLNRVLNDAGASIVITYKPEVPFASPQRDDTSGIHDISKFSMISDDESRLSNLSRMTNLSSPPSTRKDDTSTFASPSEETAGDSTPVYSRLNELSSALSESKSPDSRDESSTSAWIPITPSASVIRPDSKLDPSSSICVNKTFSPDPVQAISPSQAHDFSNHDSPSSRSFSNVVEHSATISGTARSMDNSILEGKVVISVKCRRIPKRHPSQERDTNAVVVLFEKDAETGAFEYVNQTEVVKSSNPNFSQMFVTGYEEGQSKELVFNVYDVTGDSVEEKDCLGLVLIDLLDVYEQRGKGVPYQLVNSEDQDLNSRLEKSRISVCCIESATAAEWLLSRGHESSCKSSEAMTPTTPSLTARMLQSCTPASAFSDSPAIQERSEEFSIRVSCKNLPVKDQSQGNPLVAMFVQTNRTEMFKFYEYNVQKKSADAINPEFVRPFVFQVPVQSSIAENNHSLSKVDRSSELILRLSIYDMGEAQSKDATDQDMVGYVYVSLKELREASLDDEPLTLRIEEPTPPSIRKASQAPVILLKPSVRFVDEVETSKSVYREEPSLVQEETCLPEEKGMKLEMTIKCRNLTSKSAEGAPTSVIGYFSRTNGFGEFNLVSQTESQHKRRNPKFKRGMVAYLPVGTNPEILLNVYDVKNSILNESDCLASVLVHAKDLLMVLPGTELEFKLENTSDRAVDSKLKSEAATMVICCKVEYISEAEVSAGLKSQKSTYQEAQERALSALSRFQEEKRKEATEQADLLSVMMEGSIFTKHANGRGKPKKKLIFFKANSIYWCDPGARYADADKSLSLEKITSVLFGKQTKCFSKKGASKADPDLCFSLICDDRTLDLEAPSMPVKEVWLRGLRRPLIECNSAAARCLNASPLADVPDDLVFSFTTLQAEMMPLSQLTDHSLNIRLRFNRKDTLQPSKRYAITVQCKNLVKIEWRRKIQPLVALFVKNDSTGELEYVAQTEWLRNSDPSPTFTKKFIISHHEGEDRDLMFNVYCVDSPNVKVEDRIGGAVVNLKDLVQNDGPKEYQLVHFTHQKRNSKLLSSKSSIIISCSQQLLNLLSPQMAMAVPRPKAQQQRRMIDVMKEGRVFTKYSHRKGKAMRRKVFYVETLRGGVIHWCEPGYKLCSTRHSISIASITDVLMGKQTQVFKRSAAAGAHEDHCFSLVTQDRTLDLECESKKQRNAWIEGIRSISQTYGLRFMRIHKTPSFQSVSTRRDTSTLKWALHLSAHFRFVNFVRAVSNCQFWCACQVRVAYAISNIHPSLFF